MILILSSGDTAHAAPAAASQVGSGDQQSRDEAWWTGPLLAASASTLPQGHFLVEPYLFDAIANGRLNQNGSRTASPHSQTLGSLTYLIYGLTDEVSVGIIPRFSFTEAAGASRSSGIGLGDLSIQAQYRLTQLSEESRIPTISAVVMETLPTGKYDRLHGREGDGAGLGAYTTTLALYSQDYFWMPNGRILRARLDFSYALPDRANVNGESVYGTPSGFHGHAQPGASFVVDAAAEYSVTQNWALSMDVYYEGDGRTVLTGGLTQPQPASYRNELPTSDYVALAPAIEFNWSPRFGIIVGARIVGIGRNTSASVTPVAAINMVF
jgi:hypothetical protein